MYIRGVVNINFFAALLATAIDLFFSFCKPLRVISIGCMPWSYLKIAEIGMRTWSGPPAYDTTTLLENQEMTKIGGEKHSLYLRTLKILYSSRNLELSKMSLKEFLKVISAIFTATDVFTNIDFYYLWRYWQ